MSDPIAVIANAPPNNLLAEQYVLSACFEAAGLEHVAETVAPEDFYADAHQTIYRAMLDLHAAGTGVDIVTLQDFLKNRELLDRVGGTGYLATLENCGAGLSHSLRHIPIVRVTALRRAQRDFAQTVLDAAEDTARDAFEAQDWLEGELMRIGEERGYASTPLGDAVDESDRLLREGECGMPFHVRALNRYVTMNRGLYTAIGGTRSTGKSRFALGEVRDKCARGIPVLMFSLEMTRLQLLWALYALEIGIPLKELRAGVRDRADWFRNGEYAAVLNRVKSWPLEIDDRGGLTVRQMAAKARRFKRQHRGAGLVVIDFAQRIRGAGKDERERYANTAADLADMAKQLDMPVLLLMQVTESGRDNALGVPEAHARGSLEYEILAETVLILNRPGKRIPDSKPLEKAKWEGKAQAWISKNRMGTDEGIVLIGWREGVGQFCDLEREEPMRAPTLAEAAQRFDGDEVPDFGDPFAED